MSAPEKIEIDAVVGLGDVIGVKLGVAAGGGGGGERRVGAALGQRLLVH